MHYLKENMKFMRTRMKLTQEQLAASLDMTRSTYNSIESSTNNPKPETLTVLSDKFQIPINNLINTDLSKLFEEKIRELQYLHTTISKYI